MAETKTGKISDLTFDDNNFNRHTEEGKKMLRKSIDKFGYGRSIVADKNGRIIGGNGIVEVSDDADTIVVETTGDKLVVVKRTDIDLDSKKGREMALADNATGFADLSWNTDAINSAKEEWDINTEEWGVQMPTIIDPDDFFEDYHGGSSNTPHITVEVPKAHEGKIEDLKAIIREALIDYEGIKVK